MKSRTRSAGAERRQADGLRRAAAEAGSVGEALSTEPKTRSRFAWCVTGSGHFLDESMALAARLPEVDLFLSAAAEEVLEIYKLAIESLKPQFRVFRDKTASGVPVGMLYDDAISPRAVSTSINCRR